MCMKQEPFSESFVNIRLESHFAVQFLAAFARAELPPQPDESHKAMSFDEREKSFQSKSHNGRQVSYHLPSNTLQVKAEGKTHAIVISGKTVSAVLAEMVDVLKNPKIEWPQYDSFPKHALATGASFSGESFRQEREFLASLYSFAKKNLENIDFSKEEASPTRIWPHHFDIARYLSLDGEAGIGIGMSPGDEHYDLPYYYCSPWPYPEAQSLPGLPEPAFWHTEGFTSAIIPVTRLSDSGVGNAALDSIHQILKLLSD